MSPPGTPEGVAAAEATPLSVGRVLLIASCAALWAGLLEEVPVFLAPYGGVIIRLGRQSVWMTPLGDALFFGVAALLLLAAGTVWPRARSRDVVVGIFTGLFVVALGLFFERLYAWAVLLFAVGIGSAAARRARGPARRPERLGTLTLAGLLIVLGLTAHRYWNDSTFERRATAALPVARRGSPNILLLILDTVRGPSLDVLNGPGVVFDSPGVHAPTIDSLAAAGVLFTDAMAPAPWTLPSHASMFTGQWPTQLTASWDRPLGTRYPTIAEVLAEHGYVPAGFVANLLFASRETGLARGFLHYEDYPADLGQIVLSCSIGRRLAGSDFVRRATGLRDLLSRKDARSLTDDFLDWQAEERDRPFFGFINFFDAHEPYFPPDSMVPSLPAGAGRYTYYVGLLKGESARRDRKWTMTPRDREGYAAAYDRAILSEDAAIRRLLDALRRRGVLENTILVIAGDHGEQLGEHGLYEHENSLYTTTLHVPLIISGPGVPQGEHVDRLVSLRDVGATILDLAGLQPETGGIGGSSLATAWREPRSDAPATPTPPPATADAAGPTSPGPTAAEPLAFAVLEKGYVNQPWYPSDWGPAMFSILDSTYQYIRNGDGTEELYDRARDPAELEDLHARPAMAETLGRFRGALDTLVRRLPPRRPVPHPAPPSPGGR